MKECKSVNIYKGLTPDYKETDPHENVKAGYLVHNTYDNRIPKSQSGRLVIKTM